MKNCPNCGAVIDPYRVKCEYCGTMYFDWATWLQDGQPCFINYSFNAGYGKGTITAQAIPHLETVEINDEPTYITDRNGNNIACLRNNLNCELHVNFRCLASTKDKTFFNFTVGNND